MSSFTFKRSCIREEEIFDGEGFNMVTFLITEITLVMKNEMST